MGLENMRSKFKVQVSRPDNSTIHGVLYANTRGQALEQLSLPTGYTLASCTEISLHQACFYDREFQCCLAKPESLELEPELAPKKNAWTVIITRAVKRTVTRRAIGREWEQEITDQDIVAYEGFDTNEAATEYVNLYQKTSAPGVDIIIRESNYHDHAHFNLIEKTIALEKFVEGLLDDGTIACMEKDRILEAFNDAVSEAVEPYFEDHDPRAMGWVGSDGRP